MNLVTLHEPAGHSRAAVCRRSAPPAWGQAGGTTAAPPGPVAGPAGPLTPVGRRTPDAAAGECPVREMAGGERPDSTECSLEDGGLTILIHQKPSRTICFSLAIHLSAVLYALIKV